MPSLAASKTKLTLLLESLKMGYGDRWTHKTFRGGRGVYCVLICMRCLTKVSHLLGPSWSLSPFSNLEQGCWRLIFHLSTSLLPTDEIFGALQLSSEWLLAVSLRRAQLEGNESRRRSPVLTPNVKVAMVHYQ